MEKVPESSKSTGSGTTQKLSWVILGSEGLG